MHFFHWGEQRVKQYNTLVEAATSSGRAHLGCTPLSELVCGKARDFYQEINGLLYKESSADGFGPAFAMVASEVHPQVRELIAHVLLIIAAHWTFRILIVVESFPLRFLRVLETEPDVEDELRKAIAAELLDTQDPTGSMVVVVTAWWRQ